jgi:hypothetical protein
MGQNQSADGASRGPPDAADGGIRVVQAGRSTARSARSATDDDALSRASRETPLPTPLFPPSGAPEDIVSALASPDMFHELRTAFGGMMSGAVSAVTTSAASVPGVLAGMGVIGGTVAHAPEMPRDPIASAQQPGPMLVPQSERRSADLPSGADMGARQENDFLNGEVTSGNVLREMTDGVPSYSVSFAAPPRSVALMDTAHPTANTRARADVTALGPSSSHEESEAWRFHDTRSRSALTTCATSDVIDDASGGEPLERALAEQDVLIQMVNSAKQSAERVRAAMEATEKEARRTKLALERLERLRMASAEVQDLLDSAAATANIIGASHFPDDDEMRSFSDYLRHHPPDYPARAIS